ncbi:hypothetical protein TNIN_456181 [Trichonephila inaurata madagascariensis]|uniref:Uncharacterized protein n=1 Tax=Trichonephila inaurata madagascariensis TaxID=2747483 RepID=A0A8X6YL80_9ARAC|nr:hypothetical protein TNIN_456181 [Trichonephila inaurata madagascariensis]
MCMRGFRVQLLVVRECYLTQHPLIFEFLEFETQTRCFGNSPYLDRYDEYTSESPFLCNRCRIKKRSGRYSSAFHSKSGSVSFDITGKDT